MNKEFKEENKIETAYSFNSVDMFPYEDGIVLPPKLLLSSWLETEKKTSERHRIARTLVFPYQNITYNETRKRKKPDSIGE